jgi:GcrA cell cycle regulator
MKNNLSKIPPSIVAGNHTIPPTERKTVETLRPNDCRWPFGDPLVGVFYFCGKRKKDGSPYCEHHIRQAFQTARPRTAAYRPHFT